MNKRLTILSSLIILLSLPVFVLADVLLVPFPGVNINVVGIVNSLFTLLWYLFAAYAVIMFILAGVQYLSAQGDPGKIALAKQSLIHGSVGVVVALLSISIPLILKNSLGV